MFKKFSPFLKLVYNENGTKLLGNYVVGHHHIHELKKKQKYENIQKYIDFSFFQCNM